MGKIKAWAKNLKRQLFTLFFAYKDERVPVFAKIFTTIVVAYALSPVDLIPDFIPVLGYLDDLILVPLGIWLALKMIPEQVLADCSTRADEKMKLGKPKNWTAGIIIIFIWLFVAVWIGTYFI
ncbi:YkvA family protein [Bacillus salacetis]|uniref:YkvA family protein n=1 Tax=Bacillus salacetis TaxID=2315464 RepID=UPI003B9E76C8